MKLHQLCILLLLLCILFHWAALWAYDEHQKYKTLLQHATQQKLNLPLSVAPQLPTQLLRLRSMADSSITIRATAAAAAKQLSHPTPVHRNSRTGTPTAKLAAPAALAELSISAFGKFKLAGDPALCSMRKWRWCYVSGNVETFRRCFQQAGLIEVPPLPLDIEGGAQWQLLWQLADEADGNDYASYRRMIQWQRQNHFPGVRELGNKRYLHKNMAQAREHFGDEVYNVFPKSFTIPTDFLKLQQDYDAAVSHRVGDHMYIMKDAAKDRGEGIRVISGPSDLAPTDKGIVQSYVRYPYLLNGYKFTMRVYVVYTSLAPLRLYVYPEGFVHMATDKYNPDIKYINERYMHLTNPDINKERPFYKKNPRPFYWNFKELKQYVKKHGGKNGVVSGHDDVRLWSNIQTLVMKTILSAEHKLTRYAQKIIFTKFNKERSDSCFELLGLDVLVDQDLRPWLIEVNPDPDMSAHAGFALAYQTKGEMMSHLMDLLSLKRGEGGGEGEEPREGESIFGTKEYIAERKELANILLLSSKQEKLPTFGKVGEKYLKSFQSTSITEGCNLKLATMQCGVKTMKIAYLIADSEMEYYRQKEWQRLIPSIESNKYMKWYYEVKDADVMLACWEFQIKMCTKKDRSRSSSPRL